MYLDTVLWPTLAPGYCYRSLCTAGLQVLFCRLTNKSLFSAVREWALEEAEKDDTFNDEIVTILADKMGEN